MGWLDSSLREQYDARARAGDSSAIRDQTATNEAEIRARQTRQRAVPGQRVSNDLSGRVGASEAEAQNKIDKGRTQLSQDAGTLSETYKASLRIGNVSPNHGGNQAVWDTVGSNASQPDLGTRPKVEPIGEWHFDERGVPVAGPKPDRASPGVKLDAPSGKEAGGSVANGTRLTRGK
jgi:hypothetical protein